MTTFTVRNITAFPAMLVIHQGQAEMRGNLFGRVAVAAHGGQTVVPLSKSYTASASITLEDGNTYTTNVVALQSGSQILTAQTLTDGGAVHFHLATSSGATPDQIVLHNTTRQPVTFQLSAVPSISTRPILNTAVVVQPRANAAVSTAESYVLQAIVNGISTTSVTISPAQSERSLQVTIFEEPIQFGDWPAYALRVE